MIDETEEMIVFDNGFELSVQDLGNAFDRSIKKTFREFEADILFKMICRDKTLEDNNEHLVRLTTAIKNLSVELFKIKNDQGFESGSGSIFYEAFEFYSSLVEGIDDHKEWVFETARCMLKEDLVEDYNDNATLH